MKKQDQRLSDLKKLMQRELKIIPPTNDDSSLTTPRQTDMSVRSLSHMRNDSSVSVNSVSVHISAETAQSGTSVSDVRNGSSVLLDLASVHKSAAASQTDATSPATLSISDQLTVNGQCTPTSCVLSSSAVDRSSADRGRTSQSGVLMSPANCEYDFVRELNFKYLRHVVLKFMLSREAEVVTYITLELFRVA